MPLVLAGALAIAIELIVIALEVLLIAILIILALYALFIIGKAIWEWTQSFREAPPLFPPIVDKEIPKVQPQDIPIDEPLERPIPIPMPITVPDTKVKPKKRSKDKDIWNVYDIHIPVSGRYREYYFRNGYKMQRYPAGQIYKYGITSFSSVIGRYIFSTSGIKWILSEQQLDKETYIRDYLTNGLFRAKQWYLSKVKKAKALEKEGELLDAYRASHLGKLPPGNTKRG